MMETGERLARLEALLETLLGILSDDITEIKKMLGGNGQPGLMSRATVLEAEGKSRGADMAELKHAMTALAEKVTQLADTVKSHVGGASHFTLAYSLTRYPAQTLTAIGLVIVIVVVLARTGALFEIGKLLMGM